MKRKDYQKVEEKKATTIKWWHLVDTKNSDYKSHEQKLAALITEWNNLVFNMQPIWDLICEFESQYFLQMELEAKMFLGGGDDSPSHISYNVIRSCINSAYNKIGKINPKTTFITKDMGYTKRQVARDLDKWIQHKMKKGNVLEANKTSFLNACIGFFGVTKVEKKKGDKFRFTSIDPINFVINNPLGNGHYRSEMGEKKPYYLYQLIEKYPDKKGELLSIYGTDLDQEIGVMELFKRKMSHAIFTEKLILKLEKWNYECPYKIFLWNVRPRGVIGCGITEEIYDYQQRIIYILEKISMNLATIACTKIFVQKQSGISESNLVGGEATILEYNPASNPPEVVTPNILSPQHFQHLEDVYAKAQMQIGMNEMYTTGDVPKGLESGVAVRNFHDVGSERFNNIRVRYEQFFVEIAKLVCELSAGSDLPERLKGVNLKEEMEDMQVYPTNMIPETPAGQLAAAKEMIESGMMTPDQFISQLDAPDMKGFMSSITSRREACELVIDRALKENADIDVDEALGIDILLDRMRERYAVLLKDNVKNMHEDSLVLLKKAIGTASQILKEQQLAEQQVAMQMSENVKQPPQGEPQGG